MPFEAIQQPTKLNVALWGPSGAGKTYTALAIAHALGRRIAVVDTEHGASRLYGAKFPADSLILDPPYAPERFLEALREAEAAGYDVIILDSLSPEWADAGGCLELVKALRQKGHKPHQAWSAVTPRHDALLAHINRTPLSVIVTLREKPRLKLGGDAVQEGDPEPVMRDRFEYEYDLVLHLERDHRARVQKSRLPLYGLTEGHTISLDRAFLEKLPAVGGHRDAALA